MDNYDFIKQFARYLALEREEGQFSKEEKAERDLIYTHLKDYVITGEELLEGNLMGYLQEESFKDKRTELQEHIKNLESTLESMRKEIQGKQGGPWIEGLKRILDKKSNVLP